jgi:undecaprenyl-diphosphatase
MRVGLELGIGLLILWAVELVLWRLAKATSTACRSRWPRWQSWGREHPLTAAFAERFPRLSRALWLRLTPERFTGLPLTLMVLLAVYAAFALFGLVDMVRSSHGVVAFDDRMMERFAPYRSEDRVRAVMTLTDLGGTSTLAACVIVASAFLWAHRRRGIVGPMWLAFIGVEIVTTAGKGWIARARPVFTTIATAHSPSFPSGHTTGATVVFGFLAYAIARDLASHRRRFAIGYGATVVVLIIGVSRVFLGVHFASDVIAGWLIGIFWLVVAFAVAEHWRGRPQQPVDQTETMAAQRAAADRMP